MTLNPHRKDPSTGRTTLFTFLWVGGGYNQVYARDAAQAEEIANAHFGGLSGVRRTPQSQKTQTSNPHSNIRHQRHLTTPRSVYLDPEG